MGQTSLQPVKEENHLISIVKPITALSHVCKHHTPLWRQVALETAQPPQSILAPGEDASSPQLVHESTMQQGTQNMRDSLCAEKQSVS